MYKIIKYHNKDILHLDFKRLLKVEILTISLALGQEYHDHDRISINMIIVRKQIYSGNFFMAYIFQEQLVDITKMWLNMVEQ